jgi:hypothetical protein
MDLPLTRDVAESGDRDARDLVADGGALPHIDAPGFGELVR